MKSNELPTINGVPSFLPYGIFGHAYRVEPGTETTILQEYRGGVSAALPVVILAYPLQTIFGHAVVWVALCIIAALFAIVWSRRAGEHISPSLLLDPQPTLREKATYQAQLFDAASYRLAVLCGVLILAGGAVLLVLTIVRHDVSTLSDWVIALACTVFGLAATTVGIIALRLRGPVPGSIGMFGRPGTRSTLLKFVTPFIGVGIAVFALIKFKISALSDWRFLVLAAVVVAGFTGFYLWLDRNASPSANTSR